MVIILPPLSVPGIEQNCSNFLHCLTNTVKSHCTPESRKLSEPVVLVDAVKDGKYASLRP
jgi:hypothetical protein